MVRRWMEILDDCCNNYNGGEMLLGFECIKFYFVRLLALSAIILQWPLPYQASETLVMVMESS